MDATLTIHSTMPFLVMVIGGAGYLMLSEKHSKPAELCRIAFFVGLFFAVWSYTSKHF